MSYQALYRKYRPDSFDKIVGQEHIVRSLQNAIATNKIGHAYLFAGPRGTGKTSTAKVFAAKINNVDFDKLNTSMDIVELDAASNNGVAEVREIIDQIRFSPSELVYKVYIIDEVHMLSKGAFNALLKTLEEPPANVIFILATTEAQKIPLTIMSRVQRFNFKRIDPKVIQNSLQKILDIEEIGYDSSALKQIARLSRGSLRDAISIADQVSTYEGNKISGVVINEVFGLISNASIIRIINFCIKRDVNALLSNFDALVDKGADVNQLTLDIIGGIKDFIIYNKIMQPTYLSILDEKEINSIDLSVDEAYDLLDSFVELHSQLINTQDPEQDFDLTILKICRGEGKGHNTGDTAMTNAKVIAAEEKRTEHDLKRKFQDEVSVTLAHASELVDEIKDTVEITLKNTQVMDQATATIEAQFMNSEPVKEDIKKESEVSNKLEKTSELLTINEIIELVVQGDKNNRENVKKNLPNAANYINEAKYAKYANWIMDTRSVSAGENFVLLSHKDIEVVQLLNANRNKVALLELTKRLFGVPKFVYAMFKNDYEQVEKAYIDLKRTNALPTPKPIPKPDIDALRSNDENHHSDLEEDEKIAKIFGYEIKEGEF